jgi:hypothetical protein
MPISSFAFYFNYLYNLLFLLFVDQEAQFSFLMTKVILFMKEDSE